MPTADPLDGLSGGEIGARLSRIEKRYEKVHAVNSEDFALLIALAHEGRHSIIVKNFEAAPMCMCRMLGRTPAIAVSPLGRSWCHTCGKPTT